MCELPEGLAGANRALNAIKAKVHEIQQHDVDFVCDMNLCAGSNKKWWRALKGIERLRDQRQLLAKDVRQLHYLLESSPEGGPQHLVSWLGELKRFLKTHNLMKEPVRRRLLKKTKKVKNVPLSRRLAAFLAEP